MKWISVEFEGWAATFVVVRSSEAPTEWFFNYSKRDAERVYRQRYGLVGMRMRRIAV